MATSRASGIQSSALRAAHDLLRAALQILDDARGLLDAQSPTEIQSAVFRKHAGARHIDLAWCWTEYERRHRVFAALFGHHHSLFVSLVRDHFGRVEKGESS
jgi:hypothetical protein